MLNLAVQTGLVACFREAVPVNHTLERRAARPLRFYTINAVQVEKAVVHTQDLNLQWTVYETVALPLGEYVSFSD